MTNPEPTIFSYLNGTHSEQQVFDFLLAKLTEQGRAAVIPDLDFGHPKCVYTDPKDPNCHCGIGHLLPPHVLPRVGTSMNLVSIETLMTSGPFPLEVARSTASCDQERFLEMVQRWHDRTIYVAKDKTYRQALLESARLVFNSTHRRRLVIPDE